MDIREKIIELEKEALKQWASGNALGYTIHQSEDCSYFDNLGASELIIGKDNIRNYLGTAFADLPEHKYEMHQPHVQNYGDMTVLGYQYHPFTPDGKLATKWSATVIYKLIDENWKVVHAHWTMLQNPDQ